MAMMNIQFETYLLNEETVRLLGVYHEARKTGRAREAWSALGAGRARIALEAHCKKAHGLNHNQAWELYEYWRGRQ